MCQVETAFNLYGDFPEFRGTGSVREACAVDAELMKTVNKKALATCASSQHGI